MATLIVLCLIIFGCVIIGFIQDMKDRNTVGWMAVSGVPSAAISYMYIAHWLGGQ